MSAATAALFKNQFFGQSKSVHSVHYVVNWTSTDMLKVSSMQTVFPNITTLGQLYNIIMVLYTKNKTKTNLTKKIQKNKTFLQKKYHSEFWCIGIEI